MRLGLQVPDFTWPGAPESIGPTLRRIAGSAEDAGMTSFWVMDHFFQISMVGPPDHEMLEGYTTLGHVAAVTDRITLGLMVTGVTYRHPGLLAKVVTTLDVLSGGRAQLGIGAAWYEREHRGLGVPFPPLAERFERLEETLQICRQMWSDDNGPYDGTHYRLAETICSPRPISSPHPRILIGGSGERKTLRLVARYADACNLFASSPDEVAHKLAVLEEHCATEDRNPAEIDRTILAMVNPLDDPDGFITTMADYAALGITTVEVMPIGDPIAYTGQVIERIVPALAQIGS